MAYDSSKPVTGGSLVAADMRENFRALKEDDIVEGVAASGITPAMFSADSKQSVIKAWINFNGTGVIAINDSFNVTSITDNGVGQYTVTWDTDFANVNYCCSYTVKWNSLGGAGNTIGVNFANVANNPLVGSAKFHVRGATTIVDCEIINIMAIGDQ